MDNLYGFTHQKTETHININYMFAIIVIALAVDDVVVVLVFNKTFKWNRLARAAEGETHLSFIPR